MIRRIAHLCITSYDLDATVEFYRDALGFPIAFRFIRKDEIIGYYFKIGDNNFIECFHGKDASRDHMAIKHFCLETDDLDALETKLRERGVETRGRRMGADGSYQMWCTDPNGIDIEFQQYSDKSSQLTGEDCYVDW